MSDPSAARPQSHILAHAISECGYCWRPGSAHQDIAGALPSGVAEGELPPMRGGDDAISHAPGRGGGGAGKGHFFGDDMQLLPEQDRAGCEDV
jgi:hypothetical protein